MEKDNVVKEISKSYSEYLNLNLENKLKPVNKVVDEMLARLEELETMILLVQQERCNAMGLTGNFAEIYDASGELKNLGKRIDALENMVEHIKTDLNQLEVKLEAAEDSYGHPNNTTKIKNLIMPILKLNESTKPEPGQNTRLFSTEDYFKSQEDSA